MLFLTSFQIVVIGDAGIGKSTLIGVLASGVRDDGQGSARRVVRRRTSQTKDMLLHQGLQQENPMDQRAETFLKFTNTNSKWKHRQFLHRGG